MATDARATAATIVGQVIAGKSLNTAMPGMLEKVNPRDRGLVQQLCYGTLRQYPKLSALLGLLLDKPLRGKDRDVTALLLIGLYQLQATRVPDHAAVAATVEATRSLGKSWAKGLANAVLRRYLRESEALLAQLSDYALHAHPQWLFQAIAQQWPENAADIVTANNAQPPMTLRINSRQTNREHYLTQLEDQGISAEAGTLSPQAIRLSHPVDVAELPGFEQGLASVQDEAAQMAALLLAAEPGDRVLDACAAPGGKTCHILELQPELKELVAVDVDQQRLEKVTENLNRLGLSASIVNSDAANPDPQLAPASFDRILVDAPCSASGVIRRHPDVKLLRRPEDIGQLGGQQFTILQGLWPLLKPGGVLVYATCSILREENSDVIEQFLLSQDDARLNMPSTHWGEALEYGRQLLPTETGSDGLFYAVLHKRPPEAP